VRITVRRPRATALDPGRRLPWKAPADASTSERPVLRQDRPGGPGGRASAL